MREMMYEISDPPPTGPVDQKHSTVKMTGGRRRRSMRKRRKSMRKVKRTMRKGRRTMRKGRRTMRKMRKH